MENLSRREETALSRLRIGHMKYSHEHLLKKEARNTCEHCGEEEISTEHILFKCSLPRIERVMRNISMESWKDLINSPRGCLSIIQFLRELEYINKM